MKLLFETKDKGIHFVNLAEKENSLLCPSYPSSSHQEKIPLSFKLAEGVVDDLGGEFLFL